MKQLLRSALLYCRTIRHLRARQAVALLRRPLPRGQIALGPLPRAFNPAVAAAIGGLGPVAPLHVVHQNAASFETGSINMLGRAVPLDSVWRILDDQPPLWRYHFHYHDVLADVAWVGSQRERGTPYRALEAFISQWETCADATVWDPYPVSVRLVNWLRILAWAGRGLDKGVQDLMLRLLGEHVLRLAATIEWHLAGNHLLRNATSLTIGAHAWSDSSWDRLRRRSLELFNSQLLDQVRADGFHEERSPMYHVRALRDVLEVAVTLNAVDQSLSRNVYERAVAMAEAVPWFRRSDGSLYLLNDSAHDHGVSLDGLLHAAAKVLNHPIPHAEGVRYFRHSGVVVLADERLRTLVDVAGPSPAHQPGHAHAGALGIELDMGRQPVIVDAGCSGYDGDPMREYFRGSTAHNTVTIDALDQSEMWATFRVARRARVRLDEIDERTQHFRVHASCTPYHDRSAHHHRVVRRLGQDVAVTDWVEGASGRRIDLHWHLHPNCRVAWYGDGVVVRSGETTVRITVRGADEVHIFRGSRQPPLGWHANAFGQVVPSWTVRATVHRNEGSLLETSIRQVSC